MASAAALLVAAEAGSNGVAAVEPGALDTTFGSDGIVTVDFAEPGVLLSTEGARGVAVQPDGRIITAGSLRGLRFDGTTVFRVALARFMPDGTPDPSFGGDGTVTSEVIPGAEALELQPDGKILVAGGDGDGFAVARFIADGSVDATFGDSGVARTSFGFDQTRVHAIGIQSDGKIVATGRGIPFNATLVRYNADGSQDLAFGVDGVAQGPPGVGYALVIQPDGRIVTAGSGGGLTLARYAADGTPDGSFGQGGVVTTPLGEYVEARGVAVLPDGRLVAVGFADGEMAVAQYTSDGELDPTFAGDGTTTLGSNGSDTAHAVIPQANGKLLVGGGTAVEVFPQIFPVVFTVVRFNRDGSLDSSFAGDGVAALEPAGFSFDVAADLALQPDGRLVAAGYTNGIFGGGFLVARFLINTPPTIDVAGGGCPSDLAADLNLAVEDADGDDVTVAATSSDQAFVPDGSLSVGGSGNRRVLGLRPSRPPGTALVTIRASDGEDTTDLTISVKAGTAGVDGITGTDGADVMFGVTGSDRLDGSAGPDVICGGKGDDTLTGGPGPDTLVGGQGADTLTGGPDADLFSGGRGTDFGTDFDAVDGDTDDGTVP